jgi:hypothetical protein
VLAATGHRWTLHHGLRRGAVVPALGTFKLGVELGQVAIVSIVTPACAFRGIVSTDFTAS